MNRQIKKQLSLLSILIFIIFSENYCGTTFSKVMREMVTNEMKCLNNKFIEAARAGNLAGVQDALDKGVNIEAVIYHQFNRTALAYAAKFGHIEIVKFLLSKGANIEAADNIGYTGLIWAAGNGHNEIVRLLLDNGANIEAVGGYNQRTAFLETVTNGHAKTVKLLLDNNAHIEFKDNYGWTALIEAVSKGNIEVANLLLDSGADIETKNNKGYTALILAAENGDSDIVKLLLDRGAQIEAKNKEGCTALIMATKKGKTKVVKLLLDQGADTEVEDNQGATALIIAANSHYMNNINMINMLIEAGAIAPDPEKYTGTRDEIKNILDRVRQEQLALRGQFTKSAAKKDHRVDDSQLGKRQKQSEHDLAVDECADLLSAKCSLHKNAETQDNSDEAGADACADCLAQLKLSSKKMRDRE